MGALAKKCWGFTEQIAHEPGLHLHRISFVAGGVCSEHYHNARNNLFYVMSGEMLIREWAVDDDRRCTETRLKAGECHTVQSGVRHQFEGLLPGTALEAYWCDEGDEEVDENDIVRLTTGFLR